MRLLPSLTCSLLSCQSPALWPAPAARSAVSMQIPAMPDFMKGMKLPGQDETEGLSKEQAEEMEARMKAGGMSFDDFLMQVKVMQKAGSMQAMMQKMPFGGGGQINDQQLKEGEAKLKRYGKYVEMMSAEERTDPALILDEMAVIKSGAKPERMQRIADAAGVDISQVASFVAEFGSLRTAAMKFANGANPEDIRKEMMEEQQAGGGGAVNRAQRRAAKRKGKGAVRAKPGGFGR